MRFLANWINRGYLRDLLAEIRVSNECDGVTAAVAYITWADDLIDFCVENGLPLRLFCLLNADARPSISAVERCLDHAIDGWELWLTADFYHPKVIWFRGSGAYIGSANLTRNAWFSNVEAGVFFDRSEMVRDSMDAQLTAFFEAIKHRFRRATHEDLKALKALSGTAYDLREAQQRLRLEFRQAFTTVPGSDSPAAVDRRVSPAKEVFVQEWTGALEILRQAQRRLAALQNQLGRRWVPMDTPLAVEVGQAINFYYENHISGVEQAAGNAVETLHSINANDPQRAVDQMLSEWMTSEIPDSIRALILDWAPAVKALLKPETLRKFTLDDWSAICLRCHAVLNTARQMPNAIFGKPNDATATREERAGWYAEFTWSQRTIAGRTLPEVLQYLIWDDQTPAAERVWNVVHEPQWKLPYFGISTAGELIGCGRPEDTPPRNNRDSRVLYALGFGVQRYGS